MNTPIALEPSVEPVAPLAGIFAHNRRSHTIRMVIFCLALFVVIGLGSFCGESAGLDTNLKLRNQPPGLAHPFGTDWMGRDMLLRTWAGLSLSLRVGLFAASVSALGGLIAGAVAAILGGKVDASISWLIDVFMSLPHMVMQILLSFALGGGLTGVVGAVALTHWPGLARVMRAEVLQLKSADYIKLSARLGRTPLEIARYHLLPHLWPQFLVGLILLFPHAILHEASITFIGIGLSPHQPAIGVILSESMRHLSTGYWWLALMPGAALLAMVKLFDVLGENVRALIDPRTAQE